MTQRRDGIEYSEDKVVWDEDTSSFILNKLSFHQWFVKVAVTQWFGSVLGEPKRQVKHTWYISIWYGISLDSIWSSLLSLSWKYSSIRSNRRYFWFLASWMFPSFTIWSISMGSSICSFLPWSRYVLSPPLSQSPLPSLSGVAVRPLDDNMADKLSIAIVDVSSNVHSSHWQSLLSFLPLTQRLVNVLDVTIDCRLERINGAIYHSESIEYGRWGRGWSHISLQVSIINVHSIFSQGRQNWHSWRISKRKGKEKVVMTCSFITSF